MTTDTPAPNQLTISGGFASDNVLLVDGVGVNDNLLGSMNDLYIKDASNTHYPTPRAGIDGGRLFNVAVGFRF